MICIANHFISINFFDSKWWRVVVVDIQNILIKVDISQVNSWKICFLCAFCIIKNSVCNVCIAISVIQIVANLCHLSFEIGWSVKVDIFPFFIIRHAYCCTACQKQRHTKDHRKYFKNLIFHIISKFSNLSKILQYLVFFVKCYCYYFQWIICLNLTNLHNIIINLISWGQKVFNSVALERCFRHLITMNMAINHHIHIILFN